MKPFLLDEKTSNHLYQLRGVAMFFVVSAHCSYIDTTMQFYSSLLGLIGVPTLFILSGFFLDLELDGKTFWKKKMVRIVLPWITWSIITYILHCLSDQSFTIKGLVAWGLGFNTWLYYIPVYLILILLFRLIGKHSLLLIIITVVSLLSNILTSLSVLDNAFFTPYQNFFNWAVFFVIGLFIKSSNCIEIISSTRSFLISIAGSIICVALFLSFDIYPYYWTFVSIPFELLCFCVLLSCSQFIRFSIIKNIGKNSLLIYFLHMQVGLTIVNKGLVLLKHYSLPFVGIIFKPIIILLVTYFLIICIGFFLNLTKMDKLAKTFGFSISKRRGKNENSNPCWWFWNENN